ncbi:MAG TPA: ATP-binding protein, partial [Gammaproteobacteria bacterium]
VLLNLILNACEAMSLVPCERRVLSIRTELRPDGAVQVSVSDTGPGLTQEALESMFEPFYTSKEQGIGLGLAICRTVIARHQGEIWGECNAECGATFSFRLPAAQTPRH